MQSEISDIETRMRCLGLGCWGVKHYCSRENEVRSVPNWVGAGGDEQAICCTALGFRGEIRLK